MAGVFAKKMNKALLLISSLLSAIFLWIWYTQYFQWLDCFNSLGRCFSPDETGIVYTDNNFYWILPAILFSVTSLILSLKLYNHK